MTHHALKVLLSIGRLLKDDHDTFISVSLKNSMYVLVLTEFNKFNLWSTLLFNVFGITDTKVP